MRWSSKRAEWCAGQLVIAAQYLADEDHHELVKIRGEIDALIQRLADWADGAELAEGMA
jgi:hypothetical protein